MVFYYTIPVLLPPLGTSMNKPLKIKHKINLHGPSRVRPIAGRVYRPFIPRAALAVAAALMGALTITLAVILPAQVDSAAGPPVLLAKPNSVAPGRRGMATGT